jgi:GTPase SAR1 family protein
VYDITSRASSSRPSLRLFSLLNRNYKGFMNARSWLADVREHADPQLSCILVGNKLDLISTDGGGRHREVSYEEAELFAKEEGLLFVEASAKSGKGVEEAFERACMDILDKIKRGVFDDERVSYKCFFSSAMVYYFGVAESGCEVIEACK